MDGNGIQSCVFKVSNHNESLLTKKSRGGDRGNRAYILQSSSVDFVEEICSKDVVIGTV